ncbi:DUF7344 domain-containing protein [Halobacterium wangiae]|uniref:DUF7344 domain-containing protein n=1 Tax=Halobacterium wangiae TaxID=2902623 RepID=UPI001E3F11F9|nr:hypothetical protein [Halobacterium wangiae]
MSRLHAALASDQRRLVLAYFERTGEATASLDDLTAFLATQQADTEREHVRKNLHHRDLPKLADQGLIDYDARSATVRYWGAPTVVPADEWSQYLTRGVVA